MSPILHTIQIQNETVSKTPCQRTHRIIRWNTSLLFTASFPSLNSWNLVVLFDQFQVFMVVFDKHLSIWGGRNTSLSDLLFSFRIIILYDTVNDMAILSKHKVYAYIMEELDWVLSSLQISWQGIYIGIIYRIYGITSKELT